MEIVSGVYYVCVQGEMDRKGSEGMRGPVKGRVVPDQSGHWTSPTMCPE